MGTATRVTLGLLVTKSRLNCQHLRSNTCAPRATSHSPGRLVGVTRPLRTCAAFSAVSQKVRHHSRGRQEPPRCGKGRSRAGKGPAAASSPCGGRACPRPAHTPPGHHVPAGRRKVREHVRADVRADGRARRRGSAGCRPAPREFRGSARKRAWPQSERGRGTPQGYVRLLRALRGDRNAVPYMTPAAQLERESCPPCTRITTLKLRCLQSCFLLRAAAMSKQAFAVTAEAFLRITDKNTNLIPVSTL